MDKVESVKNILLLGYVGASLLLIALAIPLAMDKIKPNFWYGFRTPRTLKDPDIWYKVNNFFGKRMIIAGALTAFSEVALYFLLPPSSMGLFVLGAVVILLGTLTWAVISSFVYLSQL